MAGSIYAALLTGDVHRAKFDRKDIRDQSFVKASCLQRTYSDRHPFRLNSFRHQTYSLGRCTVIQLCMQTAYEIYMLA